MMNAAFGRLILLLLLPILMVGCGKDEENSRAVAELGSGDIRWASFPVDIKVDEQILSDSEAYNDLTNAITYWERKAGKRLFSIRGPWEIAMGPPYAGAPENPHALLDNVIFLQPNWPFEPSIKGKTIVHSSHGTIENSVVLLSGNGHYCPGNCLGDPSSVSRRKLIAHELGHFIGFGHSGTTNDLMYPEILTYKTLDSLEVDALLLEKLTK